MNECLAEPEQKKEKLRNDGIGVDQFSIFSS
jgi:hypothetical protein